MNDRKSKFAPMKSNVGKIQTCMQKARLEAASANSSEPANRRKLATTSNGDQRFVTNKNSQYQVFDHVMWVTMPMPPGKKCCDDVDGARIIIQHAGESCVTIGGGGSGSTKSPKARRV